MIRREREVTSSAPSGSQRDHQTERRNNNRANANQIKMGSSRQRDDDKIQRFATAENNHKHPPPPPSKQQQQQATTSSLLPRLSNSSSGSSNKRAPTKQLANGRAGVVAGSNKRRPPSVIIGRQFGLQAAICFLLSALTLSHLLQQQTLVGAAHLAIGQEQDGSAAVAAAEQDSQPGQTTAALEAELNAILDKHEPQDLNSRLLSQEIISRLMIGNLTSGDQSTSVDGAGEELDGSTGEFTQAENSGDPSEYSGEFARIYSGPEAIKMKKLFSLLNSAQLAAATGASLNIGQYPVLPASQAATIKRASSKISNLLRQQQARQNNYGRTNTYDFGLGKRPDSSVSSNVLRFGDSSIGSGHVQSVSASGLGKRPAHRYDFGLGKRVASPTYPRYDFGLGKRAPNRIRYDFGLGK